MPVITLETAFLNTEQKKNAGFGAYSIRRTDYRYPERNFLRFPQREQCG